MEEDPSRPFLVLGDIVQDLAYIDHHTDFQIVECGRKAAYGCGPNGDAIVRGLALFVRLGGGDADDPYGNPKLCISATDEALECVGSEIDDHRAKVFGTELRLSGRVCTADADVMVVRVSFVASFSMSAPFRTYYLVYDSAAASLSLLPDLPPCCRSVGTEFPLKVKVGQDSHNYSLFLMAERSVSPSAKYTDPVLCLWSPAPPPSPDDDNNRHDYSKRAWDLKARVAVVNAIADTASEAEPFKSDMAFLFKGNVAMVDLTQGILYYCDCNDLIGDTEPVGFKHIMLPSECTTSTNDDNDSSDSDRHRNNRAYRTIGCVGESVWLVIIEPSFASCAGDSTVKVWSLDLVPAEEEMEWNMHRELKMRSIWELGGFRSGGLPETVPKFPAILRRQQEDESAVLYMFLLEPYRCGSGGLFAHLVCIDLSSSCETAVRLLFNKRLAMPLMDYPVVLDPDFFYAHHHLAVFLRES